MEPYVAGIVSQLTAHQNVEQAAAMRQYMRNQFAFLGLPSPLRKELCKLYFKEAGLPGPEQLPPIVTQLWELPEREFQYAAVELLDKCKKKLTVEHVPLLESLIIHKSWWDTVDIIAPNAIGYLYRQHPEPMKRYVDSWIASDNLWLNRTALLFQLKFKKATDERLLFDYILRHAGSNEFFIQKAIGWALREYSKTNPDAVQEFIREHILKPLSQREGLKWIVKNS